MGMNAVNKMEKKNVRKIEKKLHRIGVKRNQFQQRSLGIWITNPIPLSGNERNGIIRIRPIFRSFN
jgi:hypothetical protein